VNSQVPSKFFGGEGPQLAWGEESAKRSGRVCAVPQGESVLDASMMAELIVTKKEIGTQLKKSAGTSRAWPKSPGTGGQRMPLAGRLGAEHLILWFRGSGALLVAGFAASVRTPVEGKSGADTAVWAEVIQGHSQERRHGKRQAERSRWPRYGLQGGEVRNRKRHPNERSAFCEIRFAYWTWCIRLANVRLIWVTS
jgi:hypothetical protein